MSTEVIVRSDEVRDFDDIYEGTPLEVIATSDELKKELTVRFEMTVWEKDERNRITGYNKDGSIRIEFLVGNNGEVKLLTIIDAPKNDVQNFIEELNLKALD